MTDEEREAFYDTEVAPQLWALAKACEERGLSFVASVEWRPGETGETLTLRQGHSAKMMLAAAAVKAHGNVDALMFGMAKQARVKGHSSSILHLMGVPLEPSQNDETTLADSR